MKAFLANLLFFVALLCESNAQEYCSDIATSSLHQKIVDEINKHRESATHEDHRHNVKLVSEYSRVAHAKIDEHWHDCQSSETCYYFNPPIDCTVYNPDLGQDCLVEATHSFFPQMVVGDNVLGVVELGYTITEDNVAGIIDIVLATNKFKFLTGLPSGVPDALVPVIDHIGVATLDRRIAIIGVNREGNSGFTECEMGQTTTTTTAATSGVGGPHHGTLHFVFALIFAGAFLAL